ncbi:unnamed protein product [Rotaria socialis]|uniref:Uncharacterized protein n=2 Tax=Rotaria socialis TaxID=392032 RepID=A0A820U7U4_9BILA|nr:unnamed protein product [Rotaria socialis]CAF3337713.1 unnamed protein product [Rotaria socialis]CAF3459274.1 unnamed protein product [Rotaria socialis]CAF3517880.1 unnamed protein product [Rotaria socialis]CAF3581567.1 unnamed protein product [Rotaria socialis]
MAAKPAKQIDQYNDKMSYVARDLIWKDHVSKIEVAQKFYDKRWGFLNEPQLNVSPFDPKRSSGGLFSGALSPLTITSNLRSEVVTVSPSPRPIPPTTNRLIGWRTADKNCALEKYGKYARGQESLHKKFKWPIEGFD